MTFHPFDWEREEEAEAKRHYVGPDDPDRPDPDEYMDPPDEEDDDD